MLLGPKQVPVAVSSNIFMRRLLYCIVPWKYPLSFFFLWPIPPSEILLKLHVCTCTFSFRLCYLKDPLPAWNFQWLSMDGAGIDIFSETAHFTIIYLNHFYLFLVMHVPRKTDPNRWKATFCRKQVQIYNFLQLISIDCQPRM